MYAIDEDATELLAQLAAGLPLMAHLIAEGDYARAADGLNRLGIAAIALSEVLNDYIVEEEPNE